MSGPETQRVQRLTRALGRGVDPDLVERALAQGHVVCTGCRSRIPVERFGSEAPTCQVCATALVSSGLVRLLTVGEADALAGRNATPAPAVVAAPVVVDPTVVLQRDANGAVPGASGPLQTPQVGRTFARYRIEEEVSRGGMGVVYRAYDPELHRTVALKVMIAGGHASREQIERFQREAHAAARLHHPNIVPIHEVGVHDGLHYLTMEFVVGVPLDKLIAERLRIPSRDAAQIARDVGYALHYAHHQGILHRDIKPGNIILAFEKSLNEAAVLEENRRTRARRFLPPYRAMLMDFGLAREIGKVSTLTETGIAMGTPQYMSPEQARGEDLKLDGRSDLYSLGVVLYEMMTGEKPHEAGTVMDLLLLVVHQEPKPPRTLVPAVPAELDTICLRALAKDRAQRYQTALHFVQDVESWLSGEEIAARPLGRIYYFEKWLRRHRVAALSALGSALAVVALVAWVAWIAPALERRREAAEQVAAADAAARQRAEAAAAAEDLLTRVQDWTQHGHFESVAATLAPRTREWADTPSAAELWLLLGEALRRLGELPGSLEACVSSLACGPEAGRSAEARRGMAETLVEDGRPEPALPLLYAALREAPGLRRDRRWLEATARAHLAVFDPQAAALLFARARAAAGEGEAPRACEAWAVRLGGAARARFPGLPLCAASAGDGRVFVGGVGGVIAVEARVETAEAVDSRVPYGPPWLVTRDLSLGLIGPAIGVAVAPVATPGELRLFVLEWRGADEPSLLHTLLVTGAEVFRQQVLAVWPPRDAGEVALRAGDLDGDGDWEVAMGSLSPVHPLQLWKWVDGALTSWTPRWAGDALALPVATLDVVTRPGRAALLVEGLRWAGQARLRVWSWDPGRDEFRLQEEHGNPRATDLIGLISSADQTSLLVSARGDGPNAQGARTEDASQRAGIELHRVRQRGARSQVESRVAQADTESWGQPRCVILRRRQGGPLVLGCAPSAEGNREYWWWCSGDEAETTPLTFTRRGTQRIALMAAVDADGDGEDELLCSRDGEIRLLGRPIPATDPWADRGVAAWLEERPTTIAIDAGNGGLGPDPGPSGREQSVYEAAAWLTALRRPEGAVRLLAGLVGGNAAVGTAPRLALIRAREQAGDWRGALADVDALLSGAAVAEPEARLARARCLLRLGDAPGALRAWSALLGSAPLPGPWQDEARLWMEEAGLVGSLPPIEDRFEIADGPVRLTSADGCVWEPERFLWRFHPDAGREQCAYVPVAEERLAGAWRLEAEWQVDGAAPLPTLTLGVAAGARPDLPELGLRVVVRVAPNAADGFARLGLESGPGFASQESRSTALPRGEWLRMELTHHAAEGRLAVRMTTRAGTEVAAASAAVRLERRRGAAFVVFGVAAPFEGESAAIALNSIRIFGMGSGIAAAEAGRGDPADLGHAYRHLACGESNSAVTGLGAACAGGRGEPAVVLARARALLPLWREEAREWLAAAIAERPDRMARAAEVWLDRPAEDAFRTFLLTTWNEVVGAGLTGSDRIARAEALGRQARWWEAEVLLTPVLQDPALRLRAACLRAWLALRAGAHAAAVKQYSDAFEAAREEPQDPLAVDQIVRGLRQLAALDPEGGVAAWLKHAQPVVSLRVRSVVAAGPAARAGWRIDDRVSSVGGHAVATFEDLERALAAGGGHTHVATVVRAGIELTLEWTGQESGLDLAEEWTIGGR